MTTKFKRNLFRRRHETSSRFRARQLWTEWLGPILVGALFGVAVAYIFMEGAAR